MLLLPPDPSFCLAGAFYLFGPAEVSLWFSEAGFLKRTAFTNVGIPFLGFCTNLQKTGTPFELAEANLCTADILNNTKNNQRCTVALEG